MVGSFGILHLSLMSPKSQTDVGSPLDALRHATRDSHERLHQHPITAPLSGSDLTLPQYQSALFCFQRFHERVEAELERLPQLYIPQPGSRLILRDLEACHAPDNPLPSMPPISLPATQDGFLGLMYVVEGSKLGGVVIARNLAKTLGCGPATGAGFFCGEGDSTHLGWQRFLALLELKCQDIEQCAQSAQDTFLALERFLSASIGAVTRGHFS